MIGPLEETLLAAIEGLGGESYSSEIHGHIKKHIGKDLSPGAVLTTLYRLEEKGFVRSRMDDPPANAQRGQRSRRMFKIEGVGQRALRERALINKLRGVTNVEVTI